MFSVVVPSRPVVLESDDVGEIDETDMDRSLPPSTPSATKPGISFSLSRLALTISYVPKSAERRLAAFTAAGSKSEKDEGGIGAGAVAVAVFAEEAGCGLTSTSGEVAWVELVDAVGDVSTGLTTGADFGLEVSEEETMSEVRIELTSGGGLGNLSYEAVGEG